MILIDTNVLLDVVTNDPTWADWSQQQLDFAVLRDRLAVNPVVYAEFSSRFRRIEDLDTMLASVEIVVAEMPRPALFLAGQVFKTYRSRGGPRTSILPDFFIGAQAVVFGAKLITRDARRYRAYFPAIELVAPDR
ncbi:MAG: type II toxin-antitoxin system VapC family toxin [Xanthobacteraceae bacterium]